MNQTENEEPRLGYVYGVVEDFKRSSPVVERVAIKKETDAFLFLESGSRCTDYKVRVGKDAARTPLEALQAYKEGIHDQLRAIEQEEKSLNARLNKVVGLIGSICEECGSQRMETPSGFVCPKGHGKIHPK